MTKAMIIVNPSSGSKQAEKYAIELEKQLKKTYQKVTINKTQEAGDGSRYAKEAAIQGYEALFLMGGDGTVSEGIDGISSQENRPTVGILPLGTINNLARALQIPTDPEEAIRMLETASTKKIDVGLLNKERHFVSSVSVGPIPESVQEVEDDMKSRYGPLAYVIEGVKALKNRTVYHFQLEVDERKWDAQYSLLQVSLSNSISGVQSAIPNASVDDGLLHLICLKESTVKEKLELVPELFFNQEPETEKLHHYSFKHAIIRLEENDGTLCTMDGDPGMPFPLELEVLPGHVEAFVPRTDERAKE